MALSINKTKLDNLASEIWKSAERLRGKLKKPASQRLEKETEKMREGLGK